MVSIVLDPPQVFSYGILKSIYAIAEANRYDDHLPKYSEAIVELWWRKNVINYKSDLDISSIIELDNSSNDDYMISSSAPQVILS